MEITINSSTKKTDGPTNPNSIIVIQFAKAHQCGSVSAGIPMRRAAIMPTHVPIWQQLPSAPLNFVGAT